MPVGDERAIARLDAIGGDSAALIVSTEQGIPHADIGGARQMDRAVSISLKHTAVHPNGRNRNRAWIPKTMAVALNASIVVREDAGLNRRGRGVDENPTVVVPED